ncbi:MAG TPA: tetratricopeptide repeat protein [Vicinamibacterales bacterium]|nr:tetratricopeptide repeat protein [Vicinamibacterales bacterium]
MRWVAVALLSFVATQAPERPWVAEWLKEFAGDSRGAVIARMEKIDSLKVLEVDLDRLSENIPATLALPADQARRYAAAFATEAVFAKFEQSQSAAKLIEWACRQIRRIQQPGPFEEQWHLAAFALLSGTADPNAIEAHVAHMRLQFPSEPRLKLERGIAEELRASRFAFGKGTVPGDLAKRLDEAAKRFTEAAAVESTRGEALLRLGHVELSRDRTDAALAAFNTAEASLADRDLVYLARLFRGMAFERQNRLDQARAAFESALAVRPDTQSASIALASVLFRTSDRDRASTIVNDLLSRERQVNDPWWVYPPGDFRLVDARMASLRQALK